MQSKCKHEFPFQRLPECHSFRSQLHLMQPKTPYEDIFQRQQGYGDPNPELVSINKHCKAVLFGSEPPAAQRSTAMTKATAFHTTELQGAQNISLLWYRFVRVWGHCETDGNFQLHLENQSYEKSSGWKEWTSYKTATHCSSIRSPLSPPRNHPVHVATGSVGADLHLGMEQELSQGGRWNTQSWAESSSRCSAITRAAPGPTSCLLPTAAPALMHHSHDCPRQDTRCVLFWRDLQGIKRALAVWNLRLGCSDEVSPEADQRSTLWTKTRALIHCRTLNCQEMLLRLSSPSCETKDIHPVMAS